MQRSQQLMQGYRRTYAWPFAALILAIRALDMVRTLVLSFVPPRWWREVIELPFALVLLFGFIKIVVIRYEWLGYGFPGSFREDSCECLFFLSLSWCALSLYVVPGTLCVLVVVSRRACSWGWHASGWSVPPLLSAMKGPRASWWSSPLCVWPLRHVMTISTLTLYPAPPPSSSGCKTSCLPLPTWASPIRRVSSSHRKARLARLLNRTRCARITLLRPCCRKPPHSEGCAGR